MFGLANVYQNVALKSALITSNDLGKDLFNEIRRKALKEIQAKKVDKIENVYNMHPVKVSRSEDNPSGLTNATLIEWKNIKQNYIIMQEMSDRDAHIYWQMIFEQKCPVIIMLNNSNKTTHDFIPDDPERVLKFEDFEISCNYIKDTSLYYKRLIIITRFDGHIHLVEYFQFRHWGNYSPKIEEFVEFHHFLIENKHLKSYTTNRNLACPVIMSPSGIGRAGTLVISDIFIRMLKKHICWGYCIEQLVLKLCRKRFDAIQFAYEINNIYTHLYRILEYRGVKRHIANDMFDFAESMSRIRNSPGVISLFMTECQWAPWVHRYIYYHWKRNNARITDEQQMGLLRTTRMQELRLEYTYDEC